MPAPLSIPAVNANPLGGYIRPAAGGRMLVGLETSEREEQRISGLDYHLRSLEENMDPEYSSETLRKASRKQFSPFIPCLQNVDWETDKVGLLTYSMDGEPILGPVGQLPGLYIGVAFHSGGFAYNPVSGLLLSDFVMNGSTFMDLSAFSPDRFNKVSVK